VLDKQEARAIMKKSVDEGNWGAKTIYIQKEHDQKALCLVHAAKPGSDLLIIVSHGMGAALTTENNPEKHPGRYSVQGRVRNFMGHGADVLCWDYGGYGASEGERSEEAWIKDAAEVYKYAEETLGWPRHKILAVGHSMGTGISTAHLAENHGYAGLMLFMPFRSIFSCASPMLAHTLFRPVDLLRTEDRISLVEGPVTITHCVSDPRVPFHNGEYLMEMCKKIGTLHEWNPLPCKESKLAHSLVFDTAPWDAKIQEIISRNVANVRSNMKKDQ